MHYTYEGPHYPGHHGCTKVFVCCTCVCCYWYVDKTWLMLFGISVFSEHIGQAVGQTIYSLKEGRVSPI